MAKKPLVILEEDYTAFQESLSELQEGANALLVFLIDKNGQQIATAGELEGVDPTSLASLAAGNIAATEGLGQVMGEKRFRSLYNEGDENDVYMSLVEDRLILLVAFDEHSSLGLVRLRVDECQQRLVKVVTEILERDEETTQQVASAAALEEITDDDIDALFG